MSLPVGRYKGRTCVRPGREGELTKQEAAALKKAVECIDLELKPDGTYVWKKATQGSYKVAGKKILFTVDTFGGQTLKQMQDRAAEMERSFGLGFLFNCFELLIVGDLITSADDHSILYVEYSRE